MLVQSLLTTAWMMRSFFFPTSRLSQNIETFETEIKAEKCVKRVRGAGIRIVSAVKWTVEGMVKEQGLSIP